MSLSPQKAINPKLLGRLKSAGHSSLNASQLEAVVQNLQQCVVNYQFGENQHFPTVELSIEAQLGLICQRCNQHFNYPFSSKSLLALSPQAGLELEDLAEEIGLELFVYGEQTCLLDLIREEINLYLPQIPRCSQDCKIGSLDTAEQQLTPKPFANLKQLLNK